MPWTRLLACGLLLGALCAPAQAQIPVPSVEDLQEKVRTMFVIPRTGERVPMPTTDAEAYRLLDYDDPSFTATMLSLYEVYRRQGDDVLTAYAKTLTAQIDAYERQHPWTPQP